jgi:hypothetical protein
MEEQLELRGRKRQAFAGCGAEDEHVDRLPRVMPNQICSEAQSSS